MQKHIMDIESTKINLILIKLIQFKIIRLKLVQIILFINYIQNDSEEV